MTVLKSSITRTDGKESFNAFLNFSHHGRACTESFDPAQLSKLRSRSHIDSPDKRCLLILYLYRPELIERDHRVDSSARVILKISRLPTVTRGLPIGSRQTDRGNSVAIEHL